jgi:hypothetical protein
LKNTIKVCILLAFILQLNATGNAQQNNDQLAKSKQENKMSNQNFSTTILVDQTPKEVFNAVNNPRGWWSEEIEGGTDKLNDEFNYHFKELHRCKMKITEMIPDKKVVWLVEDNHFSFTKDKSEWIGTKIIFEISKQGERTQLHFTHEGLVPGYECYNVCHDAWTDYIQNSLRNLITLGKGQPNPKDGVNTINSENIKKNNLK